MAQFPLRRDPIFVGAALGTTALWPTRFEQSVQMEDTNLAMGPA